MKYESIADIYSANEKIRERLRGTVADISETEATALPDGEKWTIQQLVEHIGIVEHNIARVCGKLVDAAKANGKPTDGTVAVSNELAAQWAAAADVKLEAPERVQPTGNISIAVAFEQMNMNRDALSALQPDLETYDVSGPKFPHPYFGDLTAIEWLILIGGHEARHTAQIGRLLDKIRQ